MSRRPLNKELQVQMMKPLAYSSSLNQEQQQEVMDVITTAIDKHSTGPTPNYEAVAKQIKETLDAHCGSPWHCIIGEGFAYAVDAQGELAVLCFKC
ncbi:dynein light polypeptide axonemal [Cyclospora cayetanensis]|uniref:Dynein light polypeptide axonemal n=1 Tax=Cyclospora cayetanensis TaxID=88456 RepID=A0A1D3CU05_9EIME|nr:dynein light polypeptide axonemal [Cyclospora cayetanensis]